MVYTYFSDLLRSRGEEENVFLEECTFYLVTVTNRPTLGRFMKTILYFTEPVEPKEFQVLDRDQHYVDLGWQHKDKQCYQEYLLKISNKTTSWEERISPEDEEVKNMGQLWYKVSIFEKFKYY